MKVFEWENPHDIQYKALKPGSATIGVFDGLHLGHASLVSRVVSRAPGYLPIVFTFKNNPKKAVRHNYTHDALFTMRQKLEILESMGVGLCVLIDFSRNFSKLSGKDFVSILVNAFGVRAFVVGKDFKFAYKHSSDSNALRQMAQELGAETEVMDALSLNGAVVSSSRIRKAIVEGRTDLAFAMLGRPYSIDLQEAKPDYIDGRLYVDLGAMSMVIPAAGQYEGILDLRSKKTRVVIEMENNGLLSCLCKADMQKASPNAISFGKNISLGKSHGDNTK
ncbi:hypothetical protein MASR2M29_21720 [Spirochaetota bacterium]